MTDPPRRRVRLSSADARSAVLGLGRMSRRVNRVVERRPRETAEVAFESRTVFGRSCFGLVVGRVSVTRACAALVRRGLSWMRSALRSCRALDSSRRRCDARPRSPIEATGSFLSHGQRPRPDFRSRAFIPVAVQTDGSIDQTNNGAPGRPALPPGRRGRPSAATCSRFRPTMSPRREGGRRSSGQRHRRGFDATVPLLDCLDGSSADPGTAARVAKRRGDLARAPAS